MTPHLPAHSSTSLRWPRWLGAGVLVLLLPVLLVIGMAVVGVDIDINAQRAAVARMLSKQVGREVRIDGKVYLRLACVRNPSARFSDRSAQGVCCR